jgi:hypothetical protein
VENIRITDSEPTGPVATAGGSGYLCATCSIFY